MVAYQLHDRHKIVVAILVAGQPLEELLVRASIFSIKYLLHHNPLLERQVAFVVVVIGLAVLPEASLAPAKSAYVATARPVGLVAYTAEAVAWILLAPVAHEFPPAHIAKSAVVLIDAVGFAITGLMGRVAAASHSLAIPRAGSVVAFRRPAETNAAILAVARIIPKVESIILTRLGGA